MSKTWIIAQLIGLVALFFSLRAFRQNKKNKYAINSVLNAVFNIIHYLLLGALSAVITKVVALFRATLIYKREENKKYDNILFFILLMVIYFILMIINFKGNVINLLPFIAAMLYFVMEWFTGVFTIKVFALITSFIWLIYNIVFISVTGAIHNTIMIVILSIIIYKDIKTGKTGGKRGKKKY